MSEGEGATVVPLVPAKDCNHTINSSHLLLLLLLLLLSCLPASLRRVFVAPVPEMRCPSGRVGGWVHACMHEVFQGVVEQSLFWFIEEALGCPLPAAAVLLALCHGR